MHLFFIDFFKYSLEVSAGAIIFSVCVQRKENFWRRCAGVAALCAAVSLILSVSAAWMDMGDYGIVSGCTYAVLTLLSLVFVWICLKGSIWNLLFCTFAGTMLRMCAKKIFDIVLAFWEMSGGDIGLLQKGTPLRYVVYYAILIFIYGAAYLTYVRLFRAGNTLSLDWRLIGVYMVIMVINVILNNIEPLLRAIDLKYYVLLVFSEMAYYVLILCMQFIMFQMADAEAEARTAHALWQQDRRQYEQIKENIETINIKCHDLRHQIRNIQKGAGGGIEGQFLAEVEQAISVYDCLVKTGNEPLDVVLTDKRLHCETSRIQFTCIADGTALPAMDSSEIYALFGNLLENAIEYENQIENLEKRFISLTVRRVNQFAKLHVENYFEGTLTEKDGLPVSTKASDGLHGYGLKSVQRIVEKYSGTLSVTVEDGMFQVSILFPLEEKT